MERAFAELAAGRPVLVADDAGRENEVDVVLAASTATAEWVAWTVRHSSGYLCAPMPAHRADALELPLMVERSEDPLKDGVHGVGRRRGGRDDGDLGGGPGADAAGAGRPGVGPRRT